MKLHPKHDGDLLLSHLETERLLESLRFTQQTLSDAADLTFESEVRRRILRAADRLERAIESLEPKSLEPKSLERKSLEPKPAVVALDSLVAH